MPTPTQKNITWRILVIFLGIAGAITMILPLGAHHEGTLWCGALMVTLAGIIFIATSSRSVLENPSFTFLLNSGIIVGAFFIGSLRADYLPHETMGPLLTLLIPLPTLILSPVGLAATVFGIVIAVLYYIGQRYSRVTLFAQTLSTIACIVIAIASYVSITTSIEGWSF